MTAQTQPFTGRMAPVWLLFGLLGLAGHGHAQAPGIRTPEQAFQAGRETARSPSGVAAAAAPARSASAPAAVPRYGAQVPQEASLFQAGRQLIGGAGLDKIARCRQGVATTAYEQQECNAINHLQRQPGERARFTLDRRTDAVLLRSAPINRQPGVIDADQQSVCQVQEVRIPGTWVEDSCQETQTLERLSCDRVLAVSCTPQRDGCDPGGIVPSSWEGDMATTWTAAGDGSYLLQFGTLGDNYWPAGPEGQAYDRRLSFDILDPALITQFTLIRAHFDDWLLVRVNGAVVYVGPQGGDRLELVRHETCSTDADGNTLCSTAPAVQYSETGFGPVELNTNWNQQPGIDLRPFLLAGRNQIDTRTIVGDRGESAVVISTRQQCPRTCTTRWDETACAGLDGRTAP